jgi:hypothetical protein
MSAAPLALAGGRIGKAQKPSQNSEDFRAAPGG